MKNFYLSLTIIALTAFCVSACKSKTAESTEKAEKTEVTASVNLTPENLKALIDADWDAVPQTLLDSMGIKVLKSFKEEAKDAQCDNLQYYYGKGASVELDKDGQPTKITADDEHAVVIYLTAESVANGTIAFRSETDYNDFVKKAQKKAGGEEEGLEFEEQGNNAEDMTGYEAGKWFFVNFTNDK
ncbi:MAG: hypothetical protein IKT00_14470 [Prevotella sp.]|nr:hypothetical protein [Prevotella sp.]